MSAVEAVIPIAAVAAAVAGVYVAMRGERSRADAALKQVRDAAHAAHADAQAELHRVMSAASHVERGLRLEVAQWRRVVGAEAGVQAAATGRLRARESEEIVRRVRGIARVDGVLVADESGLPLSRVNGELERRLAVCGSAMRAFGPREGIVSAIGMTTRAQVHIELRALPSFTHGAWLIAATRGDALPAYALDAAVALAELMRVQVHALSPQSASSLSGQSLVAVQSSADAALAAELSHACASAGLGAAALVQGPRVFIAVGQDGPGLETLGATAAAVDATLTRLSSALHESIDRFWIRLGDRVTVSSDAAAHDGDARLLSFSRRGPLQDAELARVLGSLRRSRAFALLGQQEAA